MDDVQAQLDRAWEAAAPTYERAAFAQHAPFGELLAEWVVLGPGGRVLDVGCGAGAALLPAARRVGPTGEAVGVDRAAGMVERTRAAAAEQGLGQVRAEVMDGAALDFEDASFDAVLSNFALAAIAEPERALAEWRRVLRPTGTLAVSVWENALDDRWRWQGELFRELWPEVPGELKATVERMNTRFAGPGALQAALEAAGFRDVSVSSEWLEATFASAQDWWEWQWSGAARVFLEALPEAGRERFRAAGFARLEEAGHDARSRQFPALLAHARA